MAGRRYQVTYERDPTGFWVAEIGSVSGCYAQGRSLRHAKKRIREVLAFLTSGRTARAATLVEEYSLEYGTDQVEIHEDAVDCDEHLLIVDDLLATGGTAAAAVRLVRKAGGIVDGVSFLIELDFLNGRDQLDGVETQALIHYS